MGMHSADEVYDSFEVIEPESAKVTVAEKAAQHANNLNKSPIEIAKDKLKKNGKEKVDTKPANKKTAPSKAAEKTEKLYQEGNRENQD